MAITSLTKINRSRQDRQPFGVDLEYSKMFRVSDLRLVFRIFARGESIQGRRDFAIERAMRPLLVLAAPEALQDTLLHSQIGRRRTRELGFERSIHALMTSVLLRASGLDAHGVVASLIHHAERRNSPAIAQLATVCRCRRESAAAVHRCDMPPRNSRVHRRRPQSAAHGK